MLYPCLTVVYVYYLYVLSCYIKMCYQVVYAERQNKVLTHLQRTQLYLLDNGLNCRPFSEIIKKEYELSKYSS